MQRFYNRTGGVIEIDGRPIEEYDVNHLRRHTGVVSQENTLFNRTIYENVVSNECLRTERSVRRPPASCARPLASRRSSDTMACAVRRAQVYGMQDPPGPESAEFLEVCEKAEAWEFIAQFPQKQYTMLGEKGVKLSGGQKQSKCWGRGECGRARRTMCATTPHTRATVLRNRHSARHRAQAHLYFA